MTRKLFIILIAIVVGISSIAVIDTMSEGLMTSTETDIQTETDYVGSVSDVTLTQEATPLSATLSANNIALSNDDKFLAVSYQQSGGLKVYEWNDVTDEYDDITGISFTAPSGEPKGASFSPDGTLFMVSTSTAPYIYLYDISGSTFTASSNTVPSVNSVVQRLEFINDTQIATSSTGSAMDFAIMELIGTSWNNYVDYIDTLTSAYDFDYFIDGSNKYYAVASTNSYLSIFKNTGSSTWTNLTLSSKPTGATYGVGFSPSGNRIAVAGSSQLDVYTFESDDTSSMTVDTQPTGEIYDILWFSETIFYANGSSNSYKYVYDGSSWDIDTSNEIEVAIMDSKWSSTYNLVIADASTTTELYDVSATTSGADVTLDHTPTSITSITHNGVSKTGSASGTTLTVNNPEPTTADLVVNYEYEVTGEYPLLNLVPIIFAVSLIAMVIYAGIKNDQ